MKIANFGKEDVAKGSLLNRESDLLGSVVEVDLEGFQVKPP